MGKFAFNSVLMVLVLLSVGCSKPQMEVQEVFRHADNLFGEPFRHEQIYNSSPQVKEWAQAVVFIRDSSGATGTGTIISENGRILTNEHVVPRYSCPTGEVCKGIKVLRAVYPGGPTELMPPVRLIAAAAEGVDASILQFIDSDRKYPFVPLASDQEIRAFRDDYVNRSLTVLGHPFGGILKACQAKPIWLEGISGRIALTGTMISGNSGSAIIDTSIGKIVGVYAGSDWDKSTVQLDTGITRREGYGTDLLKVREVLGLSDLALGANPKTSVSPLERHQILDASFREIKTAFSIPRVLMNSYAVLANTDSERAVVNRRIMEFVQDSITPEVHASSMLSHLSSILLWSDKADLSVHRDLVELLLGQMEKQDFHDGPKRGVWLALMLFGGADAKATCLEFVKPSKTNNPIRRCLAFSEDIEGYTPVQRLLDGASDSSWINELTDEDVEVLQDVALMTIRNANRTAEEIQALIHFISETALKARLASTIYAAEMVVHLHSTHPQMLQGLRVTDIPDASILSKEGAVGRVLRSIEAARNEAK